MAHSILSEHVVTTACDGMPVVEGGGVVKMTTYEVLSGFTVVRTSVNLIQVRHNLNV
jgi:hypothetical protein